MKITKIVIDSSRKEFELKPSEYFSLWPVDVTYKNFWGIEVHKTFFPTPIAKTDNSGNPLFFHYCDRLGVKLDNEISEQINRFIFIHK